MRVHSPQSPAITTLKLVIDWKSRACRVHPKTASNTHHGSAAERFLEIDKIKDTRAGLDRIWHYHPRPRGLENRKPLLDEADPRVRFNQNDSSSRALIRGTDRSHLHFRRQCRGIISTVEEAPLESQGNVPGFDCSPLWRGRVLNAWAEEPDCDGTVKSNASCAANGRGVRWHSRARTCSELKNAPVLPDDKRERQIHHHRTVVRAQEAAMPSLQQKLDLTAGDLASSASPARASAGARGRQGVSTKGKKEATTRRGTHVAAFCASISVLMSPPSAQALYNTTLSFEPPAVGQPAEITFTFVPQFNITRGKFIRLYLSGYTSGERNGSTGPDVGFKSDYDEGNEAIVWPSDAFRGWWSEGTPQAEYEDGVFNIYAVRELYVHTTYTAIIDRMAGLKSNCGHPENYTGFYAWVDDINGYHEFGYTPYRIEDVQEVPMDCYVNPASLTFDPPLPSVETHITVRFQPARGLIAGDNVTVNLKGFTSGKADGVPGGNFTLGEMTLDDDSLWLAGWDEGVFMQDEPGFDESVLILQAKGAIPAGEVHEVKVYRSNGLRAHCGLAENGTSSTISVQSASFPPWNSSDPFTFSEAVGPGCRELNFCSARGKCDYCLQTCSCDAGFGADTDVTGRDIAQDCSEYVCPAGVSWASVLGGPRRHEPDHSHVLAECSNMGVCVRRFGFCDCEEGFEGRACERYACPNGCSNHGACRSMREMALMEQATPLVNEDAANVASLGDEGFMVRYGWYSPTGADSWDSRSIFGCVCDSSWEVGLGPGQRQEAEYFGADCSLKHCPTGDDPETAVDETDCTNKTATGQRRIGADGNKCHVDCSNRGSCDHATGLCNCFAGYHGQACNMKHADGYGFNTAGV